LENRQDDSSGRPIPFSLRDEIATLTGTGLADIRLHTGRDAHEATRSLNASAFTVGQDIFFAPGRFAPDTPRGRWLLTHEIAHTLQQPNHETSPLDRLSTPSSAVGFERTADDFADDLLAGGITNTDLGHISATAIQRQQEENEPSESTLESKTKEKLPIITEVIRQKYGKLIDRVIKQSTLQERFVYHDSPEGLTAAKDDFAGRLAKRHFRTMSEAETKKWWDKYKQMQLLLDTGEKREIKVEHQSLGDSSATVETDETGETGEQGVEETADKGDQGSKAEETKTKTIQERKETRRFAQFVQQRLRNNLLPDFFKNVPAFYDHLTGKIHTTQHDATILAHEILHHYSAPAFREEFGDDLDEQLTHYFAEQVGGEVKAKLREQKGTGHVFTMSEYSTDRVRQLIKAGVDESLLRKAYFGGKQSVLKQLNQQIREVKQRTNQQTK
jgi:hypothetical protein